MHCDLVSTKLLIFLYTKTSISLNGERTFSVLKRVKNYQRPSLGECKLSALALLSIECDVVRKLNVHEIIEQFAQMKCR